jgi:hypothetical protein
MGCSDQKIFVCFCPCVVLVLVWSFSFLTGLCHAFWGFLENSFWLYNRRSEGVSALSCRQMLTNDLRCLLRGTSFVFVAEIPSAEMDTLRRS